MSLFKLKLSLLLNFFVLAILLNCVGTVALQAQRTYGILESTAGLLAVGKSLGILVASVLAVSHLARFGYRRAMLFSLGGLTLICLVLPTAPGFATLSLLFVAVGAGFAMIKVAVYAATGLITRAGREHASFMSFLEGVFSAGIVFGYILFSAFADDGHPEATGWLHVFYVIAALSGGAWLLLLTTPLDEALLGGERQRPWRQAFLTSWRETRTGVVLTFGGCVFLYVMIEQSTMNWLPTFNSKVLHLPTGLSIQMAGILAVSMGLGRLLAGLVLRRFFWLPVLSVSLLAAAGLVLLELFLVNQSRLAPVTGWRNAPLAAYVFPSIGLFLGPVYPVLNSTVLNALPVAKQGALSGLSVLFSALGSSIGTFVIGYWFQIHGGAAALRFTLIPLGGLLLALFIFQRRLEAKPTFSPSSPSARGRGRKP